MAKRYLLPLFALSLAAAACGDDTPDAATGTDSGNNSGDSGSDGGVNPGDTGVASDSGTADDAGNDAGGGLDATPTDGAATDAGDSGVGPLTQEIVPGSHVQIAQGRIVIMSTDFAGVNAMLGNGTVAPNNNRTYTWSLSGVDLAIWFANSNLDDDSTTGPDAADKVLWVAVQGSFTAMTPQGVGLGSTKAATETAYGVAPKESAIPAPNAGTLAQYYDQGILVAYDPSNMVRTVTICRDYPHAPDGAIEVSDAQLAFNGQNIRGFVSITALGTDKSTVMSFLGQPDGQGAVMLGGQNLTTLSYGFIGIEVFYLNNSNSTLFMSVHAPYYGQTSTGLGIGSTRTEFETYLTGQGYAAGTASSLANTFCYDGGSNPNVAVSYSTDATPLVAAITIPLLTCP